MRSLRSHLTYANVVATLALFVALSTGGAWAAKQLLVTGKTVKNGSLTGKDVKKRSLTGAQIKPESLTGRQIAEAKLGKVPSAGTADTAANAATLGGVPLSGLLRSDRILRGSASLSTADTAIIKDARTGLEARTGPVGSGKLRLVNTTQDTLVLRGIGYYTSASLVALDTPIPPGGQSDVSFSAAGFSYAQFVVVRRSAAAGTPALQVSCSEDASVGDGTLSCIGVG